MYKRKSLANTILFLIIIFIFILFIYPVKAEELRVQDNHIIRIPDATPNGIAVLLHGGSGQPSDLLRDNIIKKADELGVILFLPSYDSKKVTPEDDPAKLADRIQTECDNLIHEFFLDSDKMIIGGFSMGADETARISQYLPKNPNWVYMSPNQGKTAKQVLNNGNIMVYAGSYEKPTTNGFIRDAQLDVEPNFYYMTGHTWKAWEYGILDSFDHVFSKEFTSFNHITDYRSVCLGENSDEVYKADYRFYIRKAP